MVVQQRVVAAFAQQTCCFGEALRSLMTLSKAINAELFFHNDIVPFLV
jgi:hypothetical protein